MKGIIDPEAGECRMSSDMRQEKTIVFEEPKALQLEEGFKRGKKIPGSPVKQSPPLAPPVPRRGTGSIAMEHDEFPARRHYPNRPRPQRGQGWRKGGCTSAGSGCISNDNHIKHSRKPLQGMPTQLGPGGSQEPHGREEMQSNSSNASPQERSIPVTQRTPACTVTHTAHKHSEAPA